MMGICRAEFQLLQLLTNRLLSQLNTIVPESTGNAQSGLEEAVRIIQMYKFKLDTAVSSNAPGLMLKAANGLTSINKGLADQGWISTRRDVAELAWEVTKAAIKAAECVRAG